MLDAPNRRRRSVAWWAWLLAGQATAGCYTGFSGSTPADEDASSGGSSEGDEGEPVDDACDPLALGASPMRRLTARQYANSIADLLNVEIDVAALTVDDLVGSFAANADIAVPELAVEQYLKLSEDVSEIVTADLDARLGCPGELDDACAHGFVLDLGARAYRRPLSEAESDRLLGVYAFGRDQVDAKHGVGLAVQAILQSPNFLYLVESPPAGAEPEAVFEIDAYALAARLSYFLWESVPDAELLQAAADGTLSTEAGLAAQAERMLADPKALRSLHTFHVQWLGVAKLEQVSPEEDPLAGPALDDFRHMVENAFEEGDPSSLFTVNTAYVTPELAELYGVSAPAAGIDAHVVALPDHQRRGILTSAAFLKAHRPPTGRGVFLLRNVLCETLGDPPPGVSTDLPEPVEGESPRERWDRHITDPQCAGCHVAIDSLGFGFDHYGPDGGWRDEVDGWPADPSGALVGTDVDGPFHGALELADRLAVSTDVRACIAKQWFTYALVRVPGTSTDGCSVEELHQVFVDDPDADLHTLLLAVVRTPAFGQRRL